MRAVVLPGDKRVAVIDRPVPSPGAHDVLVKTAASAICRSDMSIYYGNPVVGEHAADAPLVVPGHEAAGVVVEVGSAVQGVQVGDRVAGYLAVSEQRAGFAAVGLPMLDPGWKCFGFDIDGGDADFFVLPEANCLPLPDAISFRAGAVLTDMVGTQYHTQKRLGVSARHTVAVVGLGPMGAAAVLISNALGARVMAVDVLDSRLEQASSLGATELVNSARVDPVARIAELTGGRGADVVIECSGNPVGQNTALDVAAKLGSVAFVGESRKTEINPSDQIIRKMLTVIGGWYFPRGEWDEIVRFVLDRSVAVEDLISHEFSIEDAEHAFSAFDRRETDKAVFVW
ncbi:MAG: alcohol dehydrogenase [Amnibacterium sp.]|nr:alcohol dehydrogenase [Amnibacterium sp.]